MKFSSLLLCSLLTIAASSAMARPLTVLVELQAKITKVRCDGKVSNVDHDTATGGDATVRLADGEVKTMQLIISRFADDMRKEGRELCAELKRAKQANSKVDVIYTVGEDFDGNEVLQIKGAKILRGLESLNN